MYRYVGPVVSSIEKSDLDQVLRRKRLINSSRWGPPFDMVFARRSSPCPSLPTLPETASTVLAASPSAGCYFRYLVKIIVPIPHICTCIHTFRYISIWHVSCKKLSCWWTGSYHSMNIICTSYMVRCAACSFSLFFGVPFFSPLFVWRNVVSQPSTSRTRYTRYYTAVRRIIYLACIFT